MRSVDRAATGIYIYTFQRPQVGRNKRGKDKQEGREIEERENEFSKQDCSNFAPSQRGVKHLTLIRLFRWKSNNRSARLTFTFFPEKLPLFSPLLTPRNEI